MNRTGDDQQVFDQVEAGGKVPFFVLYENTDDVSHDIVLQGKLKGQVGDFRVKITTLESGKDVTAKVLGASGRKFHNVAADFASTPQLRVRINRHAGTPDTSELRIAFTGAFDQASVCGDTVKMKVNVPV